MCYTVEVFIVNKDRVLLRMHDKYGIWLSIGGHIEVQEEDPTEAALREVKEEVGLDIELWRGDLRFNSRSEKYIELIPPIALNRNIVSPTHEHVTLVYFATSASDNVKPSEGERQDGWKWCTAEDIETMDLLGDIRDYARAALKAIAL